MFQIPNKHASEREEGMDSSTSVNDAFASIDDRNLYPKEEKKEDEGCDLDIQLIEFLVASFIRLFPEDKYEEGRRRSVHRRREDSRG